MIAQRPVVVLTCRVHPGETNASWVMQGLLWWLTSAHAKAAAIRQRAVFKIVPVLNPDGGEGARMRRHTRTHTHTRWFVVAVVAGNYRCNLTGMDLNRFWDNPHAEYHPTVVATKVHHTPPPPPPPPSLHLHLCFVQNLIRQITTWRRTALYCDFHGHSTMPDFALYGCSPETAILQPR